MLVNNQLAIQEQHDQDFKKLMTWQVLMQDKFEKLSAKVDRQAELQTGLIERIDKLVIAIGEIVRSNPSSQGFPQ